MSIWQRKRRLSIVERHDYAAQQELRPPDQGQLFAKPGNCRLEILHGVGGRGVNAPGGGVVIEADAVCPSARLSIVGGQGTAGALIAFAWSIGFFTQRRRGTEHSVIGVAEAGAARSPVNGAQSGAGGRVCVYPP